jgi:hypothetical protein
MDAGIEVFAPVVDLAMSLCLKINVVGGQSAHGSRNCYSYCNVICDSRTMYAWCSIMDRLVGPGLQ